jgi:tetratricopeptide (TPR) repeat protein
LLLLTACGGDPAERSANFIRMGDKYLEQKKYNEASIMYRRALKEDARSVEAYEKLGSLMKLRKDGDGALYAYTRVFELDPTNMEALRSLGEIYIQTLRQAPRSARTGILNALIQIAERAEERAPETFELLYIKALLANYQKEFEDARQYVGACIHPYASRLRECG